MKPRRVLGMCLIVLFILIVSGLAASFRLPVAQARVSQLYSTSCLGGWENAHLSSGQPASHISSESSAILRGDVHAQLFCGGFTGDIAPETAPQKIIVKFSLQIVENVAPVLETGLVEVLYTLNGTDWNSLGIVAWPDLAADNFEIPLAEPSWPAISDIQISIVSVPTVDKVESVLYLDAVWLEVEYDNIVEDSSLESLSQPDLSNELNEVAAPLAQLSVIKYKEVSIDIDARHRCYLDPFYIDVSSGSTRRSTVRLIKEIDGEYLLTVGSMPAGLEVYFVVGGDKYVPDRKETAVELEISKKTDASTGNFSIPVVFTKQGHTESSESSVVCQLNIINQ